MFNDDRSTVFEGVEEVEGTDGAIAVPVKRGDLIVFHGSLVHFSSENNSNKTRHALSLHYVENAAAWNPRNWMRSRLEVFPIYRSPGRGRW